MSTFDTDNTLLFEMLGKGGGTEVLLLQHKQVKIGIVYISQLNQ